MNSGYITIRSYEKAWKLDKKLYNIGNWRLWVPLAVRPMGYFAATFGVMLILARLFPVLRQINSVVLYIILPILISQYLLKQKLDGKMPLRYLVSLLQYMSHRGQYLAGFLWRPIRRQKERLRWYCRSKAGGAYE